MWHIKKFFKKLSKSDPWSSIHINVFISRQWACLYSFSNLCKCWLFVEYEFTNIFYGVFNNCAIDCIYYSQIVNDQLFKFKNDIYGLVCWKMLLFPWIFSPLPNKKTLENLFQTSFDEQWRLKVLEYRVLLKESMIWRVAIMEVNVNVSWGKKKGNHSCCQKFSENVLIRSWVHLFWGDWWFYANNYQHKWWIQPFKGTLDINSYSSAFGTWVSRAGKCTEVLFWLYASVKSLQNDQQTAPEMGKNW